MSNAQVGVRKIFSLPNDDADFSPDLARKIIGMYQQIIIKMDADLAVAERRIAELEKELALAKRRLENRVGRLRIVPLHMR